MKQPDFFLSVDRLGAVMCMGVTAGAYILTLFAVSAWISQVPIKLFYRILCIFFNSVYLLATDEI